MDRIFILSPAKTNGKRAAILFNERAQFELARRLRTARGVPLGDVFSLLSGLYFRGKLAYATAFGRPPAGEVSMYVITTDAGLVSAQRKVTLARLQEFARVEIDPQEPRYIEPLRETSAQIAARLPADCEVVLLGSIATGKYVDILLEAFRSRLVFPIDFIGRGDMSRGGLMLRAAREQQELPYVAVQAVETRRGKRPPKLMPVKSKQRG